MHFHLYLFVLSNSLAFVYVEVSQKRTKKVILGGFSDKKMAKISTTKFCDESELMYQSFTGWQDQEGYNGHTHSEHRDNC